MSDFEAISDKIFEVDSRKVGVKVQYGLNKSFFKVNEVPQVILCVTNVFVLCNRKYL